MNDIAKLDKVLLKLEEISNKGHKMSVIRTKEDAYAAADNMIEFFTEFKEFIKYHPFYK